MKVYLNGEYIDAKQAMVSVDDRGFLFADGVYEVIRVYEGKPFLMDAHMVRLRAGLAELHMNADVVGSLSEISARLLEDNELLAGDATIYIQITRGVAPRRHAFPPEGTKTTVFVAAKPFRNHPAEYFTRGVSAILVPDTRWARCDIKSIALLPNVLANNAAHDAGAFEALFVKDGVVIEGSHSNLFGVLDGTLLTYPSCNYILSGISRALVLQLAAQLGIPAREGPIPQERIGEVSELFLSGTTTEVMPVTTLDGRPVGSGSPGPITSQLRDAFTAYWRGGPPA
jgi:D-alanine transaminase